MMYMGVGSLGEDALHGGDEKTGVKMWIADTSELPALPKGQRWDSTGEYQWDKNPPLEEFEVIGKAEAAAPAPSVKPKPGPMVMAPAKKSNTALYVGIGAGVVALLGGAYLMFGRKA